MKKTLYIIIGTLSVILLGAGAYFILPDDSSAQNNGQVGTFLRQMKVTRGDLNVTVSSNGIVQPINKVEIKSKASGQIEQLTFEEGQEINKGDLLMTLDQRLVQNDFDQAKADLEVAKANLTQAENNYRRVNELFEKRLVSEQERDQATVEFVRAKAQLVKAEAALSSADERLRDTRIISPISGTILSRTVELGQIISSGTLNVSGGTLLATIADMNQVNVETYVDEIDIGRVQEGQRAKVVADAHPDDTFMGEVIRIAPLGKTQQNVTTFTVIVQVENVGRKLKAGMSASVDIEIVNKRDVLLVPNEVLIDPNSEQGRQSLEQLREINTAKADSISEELKKGIQTTRDGPASPAIGGGEAVRGQGPPQDWSAMRERMAKMSEEERQKFRQEMRQRFGQQGGGERTGRRRPNNARTPQIRHRFVMVKNGGIESLELIQVGVTNFELSEVVMGLTEGTELQATIVSRAIIANEQRNQMLRSMQSPLGGGGSPRGMR